MSIINRKDESRAREIDSSVTNKWRWDWLEKEVALGKDSDGKVCLSEFVRKTDLPGKARCIWCNDEINYGGRGFPAITRHCQSAKHMKAAVCRSTNYSLSSVFGGGFKSASDNRQYGMNSQATTSVCELKPIVPVVDRVATMQNMVLGVVAEHNLPFSMAPTIIDIAKELAKDPKALSNLSMDRTAASYKMTYGLARSFHDATVENIRNSFFSLNIDEATSENHLRVLSVLVSYFHSEQKQVIVEHLKSISLIKVNSESIFNALDDLFSTNEIPWNNLVSILMDSCNVMRGCKSGVEVRIRQNRASHLLDIDGDSCHHVHNAAKAFCKPFERHLEGLFVDLQNDFQWSADLKAFLREICVMLGITYTSPQKFVPHRWLSSYDAAMGNLHMYPAFLVLYYGFVDKSVKTIHLSTLVSTYNSHDVTEKSRQQIREIHSKISVKKMTEDGKNRKKRICVKLFDKKSRTLSLLNLYAGVLPLLKKYVCLFELREPMIHKLHDEQLQLFKDFLVCFVKPEFLVNKNPKQLKEMTFHDEIILPDKHIFVGRNTTGLHIATKQLHSSDSQSIKLGYLACAKVMQQKFPLNSATLKSLSAIDPLAFSHHVTMKRMSNLPKIVQVLTKNEEDSFMSEIRSLQVDSALPPALDSDGNAIRIDHWWAKLFDVSKYAALTKLIKEVLSCFHGPQVESSFSMMGDVIDTKAGRMKIETFSSVQTVKYSLKANNSTSINFFARNDVLHDEVKVDFCRNIRSSYSRYSKVQDDNKKLMEEKKIQLGIQRKEVVTKVQSKALVCEAQTKARDAHRVKHSVSRKRKRDM